MDRDGELPEFFVRAGGLRQQQHTVAAADRHRLLRDEVHAVGDTVDHQGVADGVRRDSERQVLLQPQVDRGVAAARVRRVDPRRDRADLLDVVGVFGHVGAAWLEHRQERHLAHELRVQEEQVLEGEEAAHDVLRRVGPVDPDDELPVPAEVLLLQLGGELPHSLAPRKLLERLDVDRDRVRPRVHRPVAHLHAHPAQVDRQLEDLLCAEQEVAREPVGVERHHVVPEQPEQQAVAHVGGKHPPAVGTRPRDVHEVGEHHVGAALPDALSHEVVVVVVQEDERLPAPLLHLGGHRVGEGLVDLDVAVLERLALSEPDHRSSGEAVETVLHEPQQRVRDDGVEVLVLLAVHVDHAHVERRFVRRLAVAEQPRLGRHQDGYGAAAALLRHLRVLVGDGGADPHRVLELAGETDQRGDETAAAAAYGPPRSLLAEGDGTTV